VAGIEEERGVAGLDRPIEREQRLWFSATITEKPSCFSVSPMVRASLTALSSFGTFL
jgi:hypothetical protein